ncbi:MAG: hypothetical protein ACM3SW_01645 [Actinomycetota bacterium]
MSHKDLRQLGPGLYVDERRLLYLDMREFLAANGLEDTPEARQAVWEELRRSFSPAAIAEITDEES